MKIINHIPDFIENRLERLSVKAQLVKNCFVLLSKREIKRLRLVTVAQLFLAILDFVGVLAIGLIGTLSVYGIQSREPVGQLSNLLDFLYLNTFPLQVQVGLLGSIAGLILVFKSLLSAHINKRTIFFLAARSAEISGRLIEKLVFSNFEQIKRRSRFENIFAVTGGVQSITIGVIGTSVNFVSDGILVLVMFVGLLAVDISIALYVAFFFGVVAIVVYILINRQVSLLARRETEFQILNNKTIYEMLGLYREIMVKGVRQKYADEVYKIRREVSEISAKSSFIASISKYVLEIAFVLGVFMFVGFQFVLKDAVGAISSISLFIATSGRVIPAILRMQGSALMFRSSLSAAKPTLDVIGELSSFSFNTTSTLNPRESNEIFTSSIEASGLTFSYRGSVSNALKDISFKVMPGEWIAVAGPTGSGKTTLVDLILGVLKPGAGKILLSDEDPEKFVSCNPGYVSYVPQEIFIVDGTIRENIALGQSKDSVNDERVKECLFLVGLEDLRENLDAVLNLQVGELGSKLSGGQRQRLGIARALYTNPQLLVLDEATSALDVLTEQRITNCLHSLKGKVTIISIAHRLSTVTSADKVLYLDSGRLVALGTFEEVRSKVPNFDRQAQLSGLG